MTILPAHLQAELDARLEAMDKPLPDDHWARRLNKPITEPTTYEYRTEHT